MDQIIVSIRWYRVLVIENFVGYPNECFLFDTKPDAIEFVRKQRELGHKTRLDLVLDAVNQ
jgi:hypothetical protein